MSDEVEVGPASELTPGTVRGAGRYAIPFFTEMVKAIAEVVAANTPTSERLAGVGGRSGLASRLTPVAGKNDRSGASV